MHWLVLVKEVFNNTQLHEIESSAHDCCKHMHNCCLSRSFAVIKIAILQNLLIPFFLISYSKDRNTIKELIEIRTIAFSIFARCASLPCYKERQQCTKQTLIRETLVALRECVDEQSRVHAFRKCSFIRGKI